MAAPRSLQLPKYGCPYQLFQTHGNESSVRSRHKLFCPCISAPGLLLSHVLNTYPGLLLGPLMVEDCYPPGNGFGVSVGSDAQYELLLKKCG
jgi:hypothetical protein